MSPELSRRLGDALGGRYTTLDEQEIVRDAARRANVWADIPRDVQILVEIIEDRPVAK